MRAAAIVHDRAFRVLGLDPAATGPTGYGVVETDGRACRVLDAGALPAAPPRARAAFPARLREIHRLVERLMEQYSPDAVAVESVFTAINMRTALLLAEVRGVVLLAAAEREVPVHSYSPREVKASIAGYGHADKPQMQQMVRALLQLPEVPRPADAADALAVALCHIYSAQARQRLAAAATAAREASHTKAKPSGRNRTPPTRILSAR